jgi:hypothetical protein
MALSGLGLVRMVVSPLISTPGGLGSVWLMSVECPRAARGLVRLKKVFFLAIDVSTFLSLMCSVTLWLTATYYVRITYSLRMAKCVTLL